MRYRALNGEIKYYPLKEIMMKYGLHRATVKRLTGVGAGSHIFTDIPVRYSTYTMVSEALGEWIVEVEEKRRRLLKI